ncbi:hypothetical protein JO972_04175 [Verrucomicrobiaceae bacterium 5K15]|uniref:DNA alkylation repair protein n=1 Tax=Oceaniferula flava TaxID=2800421 RepID=A0AAE2SAA0_9BACT|nr:hypothetical protein [Oceaniferula flavus]MBK1854138.1 hypothetical protein [Oceaniferula flavus]MBM1135444.1 hypothetical protein [Oceaniferula flavus]
MAANALMKDGLGEAAVERIIDGLHGAGADFSHAVFRKDALSALPRLELKDRVRHLIVVMGKHLPSSFPQSAKILGRIRDHWDKGDPNDNLSSFAAWPITDYVAEYGLNHPEVALPLLRYLTPLYTAEFAIRPFLECHPEMTYRQMVLWCLDSSADVRRLASEGIRPRLPWGRQLPSYIENPSDIIALLENLRDDPSDYVRRSVANNLNDISKDHPELVLETCRRWLADAVPERQWIVRHATRTLVKSGHPEVFPLLGFTAKPVVKITPPTLTPGTVELGGALHITTTIRSTSTKKQRLVIDYAIHFMKANGRTAAKVFKWKNLALQAGESVTLSKSHPLKPITTRRYYSGKQRVEVLVNGKMTQSADFNLLVP